MLKKAGLLTVGVTAGLLAVAPIASAGESEDRDDKKSSWEDDDRGFGDQDGTGNIQCDADSGDSNTENEAGAALAQVGSVASSNAGQVLSCNSFLNDFLNENEVNIAS